jgi:hypothetical protein
MCPPSSSFTKYTSKDSLLYVIFKIEIKTTVPTVTESYRQDGLRFNSEHHLVSVTVQRVCVCVCVLVTGQCVLKSLQLHSVCSCMGRNYASPLLMRSEQGGNTCCSFKYGD